MTNKKIKYIGIFLIAGIMILMTFSFVSALGVSCGYSKDTPLEMYPGEERVVLLTLQNSDKEGEVGVKGEILEGSEIASLDKTDFKVPYQSITTSAKLTIKVPESASIGDEYSIVYEFNSVPGDEEAESDGGAVSVSYGVKRNFDVKVIEKPPEPVEQPAPEEGSNAITWVIVIIVIVVVILIVLYLLLRKRR